MKTGDRVTATIWGEFRHGTVTHVGKSGKIVWVQWDNVARGPVWQHLASLTLET